MHTIESIWPAICDEMGAQYRDHGRIDDAAEALAMVSIAMSRFEHAGPGELDQTLIAVAAAAIRSILEIAEIDRACVS